MGFFDSSYEEDKALEKERVRDRLKKILGSKLTLNNEPLLRFVADLDTVEFMDWLEKASPEKLEAFAQDPDSCYIPNPKSSPITLDLTPTPTEKLAKEWERADNFRKLSFHNSDFRDDPLSPASCGRVGKDNGVHSYTPLPPWEVREVPLYPVGPYKGDEFTDPLGGKWIFTGEGWVLIKHQNPCP